VTESGYGKRTELGEYRVQGRGGQGVTNMIVDERNGNVVGSTQVSADDRIMLITNTGRVIKCPVEDIREVGRVTKGVTVMRVEERRARRERDARRRERRGRATGTATAAAPTTATTGRPSVSGSPDRRRIAPTTENRRRNAANAENQRDLQILGAPTLPLGVAEECKADLGG
jgi:hypothetical protein